MQVNWLRLLVLLLAVAGVVVVTVAALGSPAWPGVVLLLAATVLHLLFDRADEDEA